MRILDSARLSGVHETPEGYLEAAVRIARTGIQVYRGEELGRPQGTVRVYRGDDAVFDKASLERFANMPMTVEHPPQLVDSKNWKQLAVGHTGEEVLRDGEFLKIGIRVTDADAVAAIKAGKREVSVGYEAEFDWTPGLTPDGEPYDARQVKVIANHLAITDEARAGRMARIGDSWGAAPYAKGESMKTIMLGDSEVRVAEEDAEKAEAFAEQVKADKKKKDKEDAEKDAKLAELEKKAVSDSELDARVEARMQLVADARRVVADMEVAGKSSAAIKREAVVASGQFPVTDSTSEAYIDAAFDLLTRHSAPVGDSVRQTLLSSKPAGSDPWGYTVDSMKKKEA